MYGIEEERDGAEVDFVLNRRWNHLGDIYNDRERVTRHLSTDHTVCNHVYVMNHALCNVRYSSGLENDNQN